MSTLTAYTPIPEGAEAVPALWNTIFSVLSDNIGTMNSDVTLNLPSGETFSLQTNLDSSGRIHATEKLGIGPTPSTVTTAVLTIATSSANSDYIHFADSSGAKSDYLLGSRVGGTADGLNLWDLSGATMIVSFSKQSVRFFQNVVGPVFDTGGALASTYNAATFIGSGSSLSGIQAAINQASTDGIARVYVPASMYPYSASSISFIYPVQMVREGGNWGLNDVKAYGAYGDDTNDDRAAIQAAISSLTRGGTVYLPRGTYKITSTLTIGIDSVHLVGDGYANPSGAITAHATAIDADSIASGSDAITVIGGGASSMKGIKLQNFAVQMNGSGSNGAAVKMWNCSDFLVDITTGVQRGTGSFGIQLGDLSTISRVCIAGEVRGIHVCNGTPVLVGFACTSITAKTFTLGQATAGIRLKNATYCLLENCASDSAITGGYGYEVDDCTAITLAACGAESCGRARLHITGTCIAISDINGRGVSNNVDGAAVASFAEIDTGGSYSLYFENPVDTTPNAATVFAIRGGAGTLWTVVNGSADSSVLPDGIGGDATWFSTYLTVVNGNYVQTPVLTGGSATFSGTVQHGTSSAGALILVNGPANQGGAKDLRFLTAGSNRWLMRTDNGAESGSNAGTAFELLARSDTGAAIDTPLTIVRAADAPVIWTRPLTGPAGTALLPSYAYSSESSLGWYRSGVSTMALSYGTLNLSQARLVSIRTADPANAISNAAANEIYVGVGVSNATLWFKSGNTVFQWGTSSTTTL